LDKALTDARDAFATDQLPLADRAIGEEGPLSDDSDFRRLLQRQNALEQFHIEPRTNWRIAYASLPFPASPPSSQRDMMLVNGGSLLHLLHSRPIRMRKVEEIPAPGTY
jgi:hypothetical protein